MRTLANLRTRETYDQMARDAYADPSFDERGDIRPELHDQLWVLVTKLRIERKKLRDEKLARNNEKRKTGAKS